MKFIEDGVNKSADKLLTASDYDVTAKICRHHVIERVTCTLDAINVLIYFVVVTLLFTCEPSICSSAALPCT